MKTLFNGEDIFKEILLNVPQGITVQDRTGELIFMNEAAARMLNVPSSTEFTKLPGERIVNRFQMMDELGQNITSSDLPGRKVLLGKEVAEAIIRFREIDREEERWSKVIAKGVYDKKQLKFVINVIQDITEMKRAEMRIEESEQKYRNLVEMAPDVIYSISKDGKFTDLNHAFEKITGWSRDQFLGQPFKKLIHPKDLLTALEMFKQGVSGQATSPFELRILSKNGEYLVGEFRSMPKYENGKITGKLGIARNITGRKKMEETLRFQNLLLEAQSEASIDGILVTDMESRILSFNWRFIEMWNIHEKIVSTILDKKLFDVVEELLSEPVKFRGLIMSLSHSLVKESREEVFLRDGRVLDEFSAPLKAGNENFGRVWFFRDITDLKEQEKRKDEFIGMVSHELKTPLTSIKGYVQILQKRLEKKSDIDTLELVNKMTNQLNRMSKLTKDLLDISKIKIGKFEIEKKEFNINDLIKEIVEDYAETDAHKIILKGQTKNMVYGDPNRIYEVVSNLITNAIKFSPSGDKVIIKINGGTNKVKVSVQDFGIGISEENKLKIFERFFRANGLKSETYPGFGLGLYIASEIIESHQGKIWVESELNKGTTFHFTLPVKKVVND